MGVLTLRDWVGGGWQLLTKNFHSKSTTLDLVSDDWKDGLVNPLLQKQINEEQGLSLKIENFTIEELEVLAMKLSKMELKHLNLDSNDLDLDDIRLLISYLSHSTINRLSLNDNYLCIIGEKNILDLSNSSIKELCLDSLNIGENGGKLTLNLKDSLLKTVYLSRNQIGLNNSIVSLDLKGSQLEELDLSYNPLSDKAIQELLLNLQNSQVKKLICTSNRLSKKAVMMLLSGLKFTSIKELILNENFISPFPTHYLFGGPRPKELASHKEPFYIDISDSSIESLDLGNSFQENDVGDIIFNFERSPLKHLIISNGQSVNSWDSLGKALRSSSVMSLQIQMGIETIKEVKAIANSLCQTPIGKLTIRSYSMEPYNVIGLFEKLKDTQITELDFHSKVIDDAGIKALISNLGNVTTLRFGSDLLPKESVEIFFRQLKKTNVTTIEIDSGLIYQISKDDLDKCLKDSKVIQVLLTPDLNEPEPKIWWKRDNTFEQVSKEAESEESIEQSVSASDESSEVCSDNSISLGEFSLEDDVGKSQEILEKYLQLGLEESNQIIEKTIKEMKEYHRFLEKILQESLEKTDQFKTLKEINHLEEELLEKRLEKSYAAIEKSLEKGLKKCQKILERDDEEADLKMLSSALQTTTLSFFNSLSQQKAKDLVLEVNSATKNLN